MFEKAGFIDIKIEPQTCFFTMLVLKMNYFSKRYIRRPRILRWSIKSILLPFRYAGRKLHLGLIGWTETGLLKRRAFMLLQGKDDVKKPGS
jgi:hypothetical protein